MTRTSPATYQLPLGEQRLAESSTAPSLSPSSTPHTKPTEPMMTPAEAQREASPSSSPLSLTSREHPAVLPPSPLSPLPALSSRSVDLANIRGQAHAKRAMEVAAAGGHSIVLCGAPGFGKTLLAQAMADLTAPAPFIELPYHTDEQCLPDLLRQAEGGYLSLGNLALVRPITILPVLLHLAQSFPSVALVGEMRLCPCGYYGDQVQACRCSAMLIHAYQSRFACMAEQSDMFLEVARLSYDEMASSRKGESTAMVRKRVEMARARQQHRFTGTEITCNASIPIAALGPICPIDAPAEKLLRAAVQQLHFSARIYHRLLRLARTIADLAESEVIQANHLAEAIQYRPKLQF
jgi:magnesium chelatase family protein